MCLIVFARQRHPQYPLILVSNRDEFYARPTQTAHYWPDTEPVIVAGKDLQAGGTWLGARADGYWTAITNYRDLQNIKPNAPSRGDLTANYLRLTHPQPQQYLQALSSQAQQYNGFNLLVSDGEDIFYLSNYAQEVRRLPMQGVFGLSNHLLDTPWHKVARAKALLEQQLNQGDCSPDSLLDMFRDTQLPSQETDIQQTGLPLDKERMLAPMFIQSPDYGTTISTVLLQDTAGRLTLVERSYQRETGQYSQQYFKL
ncbi:NRDE family protein [Eisenibacter elegans]|jgi:uncharacterized protein with NRDE domain|uniref:NRDE family protein n=1 Tax=Eisenibacter elegans TaxID=997 RepID=UPI0004023E29|nr:NRDE family protein [Eisenibacter elegans]